MKKILLILISILLCLTFCCCQSTPEPPVPKLSADGSCTVKYKDNSYDCNIKFLSKDVENITLNSPDSLKGLTFRKNGSSGIALSYTTLICRSEDMLLPVGSFARSAADAVHDLRKNTSSSDAEKNGEGYIFKRDLYTLKTDKNGTILEMLIK